MSVTQIVHTPSADSVQSLLAKARALDQRWAEDERNVRESRMTGATAMAVSIQDCRRELREAFGIEETKNMENK